MASCSEIRLLRPLQLSLIGKAANYSSQLLAPAPLAPVTAAERTKSPQPAAPLYWQTSVGPLAGNRFPLTFGEDSSDGLHGAGLCDLVPDHCATAHGIHAKLDRQLQNSSCSML